MKIASKGTIHVKKPHRKHHTHDKLIITLVVPIIFLEILIVVQMTKKGHVIIERGLSTCNNFEDLAEFVTPMWPLGLFLFHS